MRPKSWPERVPTSSLVDDRERIARDLHDTVIQRLFAVGLSLQGAASRAGTDPALERMRQAIDDIDDTIRDIRSAIFALPHPTTGRRKPARRRDRHRLRGDEGTRLRTRCHVRRADRQRRQRRDAGAPGGDAARSAEQRRQARGATSVSVEVTVADVRSRAARRRRRRRSRRTAAPGNGLAEHAANEPKGSAAVASSALRAQVERSSNGEFPSTESALQLDSAGRASRSYTTTSVATIPFMKWFTTAVPLLVSMLQKTT